MYIFYGVAQMLAKCSFNLLQLLLLHKEARGGCSKWKWAKLSYEPTTYSIKLARAGPELVRLLKASYSYEQNFLTTAQIVRYTAAADDIISCTPPRLVVASPCRIRDLILTSSLLRWIALKSGMSNPF